MEFASVVTYQEDQWKTFWLGPTNLFFTAMRQDVYRHKETLMKQQSSSCNYCRGPIRIHRGANCDCDHIIPVNYGGGSGIDNLQLLCVSCHRLKSGFERKKQKRTILFDGAVEGCQYVVFGEEQPRMIFGRVNPGDFVKMWKGVFAVASTPGKRRVFGPRNQVRKKTSVARVKSLKKLPPRSAPTTEPRVKRVTKLPRGATSFLTQDQRRHCRKFLRVERCDIGFTFKDYGQTMGDVKCQEVIDRIMDILETDKITVEYVTIGAVQGENYRDIHIAIKLDTKRAVSIGSTMKKMHRVFPFFQGIIGFDATDKMYLRRARRIVAPVEHVDIDPNPLVFGETLSDLLRRIHNAQKAQVGSRSVLPHSTPEMIQAAICSGGSWERYSRSEVYLMHGRDNPSPFRLCFDKYSCGQMEGPV